jgi:hypothetical protein
MIQIQKLSFEEKQNLLGEFPNIKLCYDNIIHNKVENLTKNIVDYDLCSAIPCGKKCFAWFTQLNGKNVCLILELIDKKNIHDIKVYNCIFNNDLIYGKNGTILYGTLFHHMKTSFFAVEDVFYCKGNDVGSLSWINKFTILKKLFDNDIKQLAYNSSFLVFGLPLMADSIDELKKNIDDVSYKIYNIQFRSLNKSNLISSVLLKSIDSIIKCLPHVPAQAHGPQCPTKLEVPKIVKPYHNHNSISNSVSTTNSHIKDIVFKVKPDIQNDIYHLFCLENNQETFYKVAYIPDYKTSVMMNKLFRNIKENENLDLLEESDDEEEFQNENIDRFVDINKSLYMICKFNHKFKKWYPVKEYSDQNKNALIVEKHVVLDCEKNNYLPHQQRQYQNYPRNQQDKKHYSNNAKNVKNANNANNNKSYYRK